MNTFFAYFKNKATTPQVGARMLSAQPTQETEQVQRPIPERVQQAIDNYKQNKG